MNESDDKPYSLGAVIGSIIVTIIFGAVASVFGILAGAGAGGNKSPAVAIVAALLVPAVAVGTLWFCAKLAFGRSAAMGVVIGGAIVLLGAGLCDSAMLFNR
jgi:hypothetical protein